MNKTIITLLIFGLSSTVASANVRLAKIFGDGMVLQRNQRIPVWGWADKGESVVVQFHSQTRKVKADKDGKWTVSLDPENAGGPYVLSVKGKNAIQLNDVLVGDVWVCSGQSNMEWILTNTQHAKEEIAAAKYPQIRQFKVRLDASQTPRSDLQFESSWTPALPENVGNFTAVGYFFARDLYKELNIPIGLINTTWGGTDIETWTSKEAFENSSDFKEMISKVQPFDPAARAKATAEAQKQLIKKLQGDLPTKEAVGSWSSASFNDGAWPTMKLPGLWEQQALKDFDGTVWFRKSVEIAPEDAGKPAFLSLAMIDDTDQAYVNGVSVGSTDGYTVRRIYNVAAGTLKAGKNVIAIRVVDTGGGGGVYGEAADMSLTIGNKSIPLSGEWAFGIEAIQSAGPYLNPNSAPTLLYNAMINPLVPFAMKGVIWYQGEANAWRAYEYRKAFPLMIGDWRKKWGQPNFPFYFVQLSSWNADNGDSQRGSTWAELREAQQMTLSVPNTGMAVTTDIGDAADIHPRNKQDVGHRLAAVALHDTYGKSITYAGPTFKSMKIDGNKIVISFSNTGSGLLTKDKRGYLLGFDIAGEDKKFVPAKAFIQGDEVVVYQDGITAPAAVRYNWADYAGEGNLYNKEGFPAAPFRTDDWPGITVNARYSAPSN